MKRIVQAVKSAYNKIKSATSSVVDYVKEAFQSVAEDHHGYDDSHSGLDMGMSMGHEHSHDSGHGMGHDSGLDMGGHQQHYWDDFTYKGKSLAAGNNFNNESYSYDDVKHVAEKVKSAANELAELIKDGFSEDHPRAYGSARAFKDVIDEAQAVSKEVSYLKSEILDDAISQATSTVARAKESTEHGSEISSIVSTISKTYELYADTEFQKSDSKSIESKSIENDNEKSNNPRTARARELDMGGMEM